MNFKLAYACAVSTLLAAGRAHAQAPAPVWYPPQGLAHISVQAKPSTELEVVPAGEPAGSAAIARCKEYCDFWALPGRYTLYAKNHGDEEPRRLSLRIKKSSRYTLDAGDEKTATEGLVLGIAGSGLILGGFLTLSLGFLATECPNGGSCGRSDVMAAGLVVLLAGVVTTPIGWGVYAANRTRLKRIDEEEYGAAEPQKQVRVGVVGLGMGGLGLGGVATF